METGRAVRCPICDSGSRLLVELKAGYSAHRCESCTAVFCAPMPSTAQLEAFYAEWLSAAPEPALQQLWRAHTAKCGEAIVRQARMLRETRVRTVLDYGGGLGFFARGIADHVDKVVLFDMGAGARAHATEAFGDRIEVCSEARQAFDRGPYDVVLVNQVIEHVPDPVGFMRKLRPALAAGGVLIVTTPNNRMHDPLFRPDMLRGYLRIVQGNRLSAAFRFFRDPWVCLDPPRHLYAFNDRSLAEVMQRAGYLERETTTRTVANDPFGYPKYFDDKARRPVTRLYRLGVRTAGRLVSLTDRTQRHGNTLIGSFSSEQSEQSVAVHGIAQVAGSA